MTKHILRLMAIVFALCCVAIGTLFLLAFWKGSSYESPTFVHATLANALDRGAVQLGWMPDFLPPSARNIREKRNGGDGTSIMAFEFEPADFLSFSNWFVPVLSNRFNEIRPRRIYKQEPWFPKPILRGEFDKVVAQGFTIYQSDVKYSGKPPLGKIWFAAINPKKGICYMWRRYV